MKAKWYKHSEHGYLLEAEGMHVFAPCSGMADIEDAGEAAWKAHVSRLYVNAGSGAIATEEACQLSPSWVRVRASTVPAYLRTEFRKVLD